jgi:hypothetical protein
MRHPAMYNADICTVIEGSLMFSRNGMTASSGGVTLKPQDYPVLTHVREVTGFVLFYENAYVRGRARTHTLPVIWTRSAACCRHCVLLAA